MKIIDISWPISVETTGYKDRKVVAFEEIKSFDVDTVRESAILLNSHTGTHIDAPSHFIRDGKTIDQVALSQLVGPCKVVDLTHVAEEITAEVLQAKESEMSFSAGDIILLKTTNSAILPTDPFSPRFVYLHHSGAEYLLQKKVQAVGIDYLGIERSQPHHPTHIDLMKNNVVIIEGLRLQSVKQGSYFVCCLPLAIQALEAAPARAILIEGI